jgi:hypothetical protein
MITHFSPAMLYESALNSCVEIAIGLAGFSGIVAAIQSGR